MLTRRQVLQGVCATTTAGLIPAAFAGRPRKKGLAVLSFNIYRGGARLGPIEQTAKLIGDSGAQIVGVQEIDKSGPQLAKLTGMQYYSQGKNASEGILSRFPLVEFSPRKWGVKLDVPGRGAVWLFNAHLPASPYQPYQLNGIKVGGFQDEAITTAAEAIAAARLSRGDKVDRLLEDIAPALHTGEPVVLTGDFNEPSHLDWTERATKAGLHKLPVAYPTSSAIVAAGLADAYRTRYPDEVRHPGYTWTPKPRQNEVHDRLDFIYVHGLKPVAVSIVGESTKTSDLVIAPYPSDHRAVLAQLA